MHGLYRRIVVYMVSLEAVTGDTVVYEEGSLVYDFFNQFTIG